MQQVLVPLLSFWCVSRIVPLWADRIGYHHSSTASPSPGGAGQGFCRLRRCWAFFWVSGRTRTCSCNRCGTGVCSCSHSKAQIYDWAFQNPGNSVLVQQIFEHSNVNFERPARTFEQDTAFPEPFFAEIGVLPCVFLHFIR
jgi:hypothetical protein